MRFQRGLFLIGLHTNLASTIGIRETQLAAPKNLLLDWKLSDLLVEFQNVFDKNRPRFLAERNA